MKRGWPKAKVILKFSVKLQLSLQGFRFGWASTSTAAPRRGRRCQFQASASVGDSVVGVVSTVVQQPRRIKETGGVPKPQPTHGSSITAATPAVFSGLQEWAGRSPADQPLRYRDIDGRPHPRDGPHSPRRFARVASHVFSLIMEQAKSRNKNCYWTR